MSQHQYWFFFLFALGFNTARLGIWTLPPFHSDETQLWVCIMKCDNKAPCADCITVGWGKGCWEGTWLRPWEQASKNWQGTFRMCPGGRLPSSRKRLRLEHRHSKTITCLHIEISEPCTGFSHFFRQPFSPAYWRRDLCRETEKYFISCSTKHPCPDKVQRQT